MPYTVYQAKNENGEIITYYEYVIEYTKSPDIYGAIFDIDWESMVHQPILTLLPDKTRFITDEQYAEEVKKAVEAQNLIKYSASYSVDNTKDEIN